MPIAMTQEEKQQLEAEKRRQEEEARRQQEEAKRQQEESERNLKQQIREAEQKRQQEEEQKRQAEKAKQEALKAAEEARRLYDETIAGEHGTFDNPTTEQAYKDAAQNLFDVMENPDSSAAMIAMALVTFNNIAASIGQRVSVAAAGGIVVVTPREADKLEEMGCTLEVVVDKHGYGMVNIYDPDGKLIAKVTETSSVSYIEKKAKEQGVEYTRYHHGKPRHILEMEYVEEVREFQEENEAIGTETGTGEYMSKEELKAIKESDPDLYEILKKQGIEAYQKAFNKKYTKFGDIYLLQTEVAELKRKDPELYEILEEEGYDAYLKAIKGKIYEKATEEFEEKLKDMPLFLQKAYEEGGIEGYNEAVEYYNDFIKQFEKAEKEGLALRRLKEKDRRDALKELEDYVIVPSEYDIAMGAGINYDIAHYLRDNPDKVDVLVTAGFSEKDIKNAQDFNKEYLGVGLGAYEDAIKSYFKEKGWKYYEDSSDQPIALSNEGLEYIQHRGEAMKAIGRDAPMSAATFVERYAADEGYQVNLELLPRWWAGLHGEISEEEKKVVEEAKKLYVQKYGYQALFASFIGEWGQIVFMPARAISPDYEFSDLTAADWIIGAAQLAVWLSPFKILPRVSTATTGTVFQAMAGGLGLYVTAKEWGNMTPGQKSLAVIFDTLLLLPIITASAKYIKAKLKPGETKLKNFIKNEDKVSAETAKSLKELYGDVTADWYKRVHEAQSDLVEALVKAEKKPNKATEAAVENATKKLEEAVKKYTDNLADNIKFDMPPEIYKNIDSITKNLIEHTKDVASDLVPAKVKLKALRQRLIAAEKKLTEARQKYPTSPDKWMQELFDVTVLQNEIASYTGLTGAKYTKLISKLKEEIKDLKKRLEGDKEAKELRSSDIAAIKKAIKDKNAKLQELIKDYDEYIKKLKIEAKEGEEIHGGGGGNKVLTKVTTRKASRLQQELKRKGMDISEKFKGGVAGIKPIYPPADAISTKKINIPSRVMEEITKPEPMTTTDVRELIKSIYSDIPDEFLKENIEPLTESMNKSLTQEKPSELTKTKVKERVDEAIRERIREEVRIEPQPMPKPAMKTSTKVAVKTKYPTPPKTPKKTKKLLLPQDQSNKKKRKAIKKSLGAITYKRGELHGKGVWHTYHVDKEGILNRSVVLGPPPEGAYNATGKGSAKITLKKIRGKKLPNFQAIVDTGAVDDIITATSGKLTLTHVPDRISGGQAQITGGMPRISQGKGRITPRMPKLR